jgi:uncharacterized protein (TIGR02118 family)
MIAMYKEPSDREAFDKYYNETHLPLAGKIPGLVKTEVMRLYGTATGGAPPYYLIAKLYFNSKEEMDAGLGGAEGRATGKDLRNFTQPGQVEMCFAEVSE